MFKVSSPTRRSWLTLLFLLAVLLPIHGVFPSRDAREAAAGESPKNLLPTLPFDQPEEAAAAYLARRSPDGKSPIDMSLYLAALERMKDMPQYSTATSRVMASRRQLGATAQSAEALGTWSWLGPGNVGGRTRSIVIQPSNPSIMYAGAVGGGVWKTTNGGQSWSPLSDLIANIAVTSLVMDPSNSNVLYAGTGEGFFNVDALRGAGIFKTTDAGATWARLSATNTSSFYYVNRLAISPNNSQRIYAATRAGIFRSTDGGSSWSQVYTSSIQGGITDLQIRTDQSGDYLFAAEGNQAQGNILRNTDAGASGTWQVVQTEAGMGRAAIAIAPSNQSIVYALTAETTTGDYRNGLHAVFRSTSNGDPGSWTTQVSNQSTTFLNTLLLSNPLVANYPTCNVNLPKSFSNQGWYDNIIKVDPVNPNRVWVGGIDLFRSDDAGANWGLASYWWASQGNPRLAHADQHAIVFHPGYNGSSNQTMFVGNDGGVFRTDNAVTGTLATTSTATTSTAACSTGNSSIVWTPLNNNFGATQFYDGAVYPDGKTYFGGAQDNGTVRGTDGGGPNGWAGISGGDGGYVAVDPTNTNTLFVETTHLNLRKSTDGGATFTASTNGITEPSDNFAFTTPFVMDPGNPQRLWIAGRSAWRSVDGGANWTAAGAPFTTGNFPATAIAVSPQDGNYVLIGRSSGFIRRTTTGLTTDSTTSWSQSSPPGFDTSQPTLSWLAFDPTNKNVAYATYSTFGVPHVWKSTDAGATWSDISGSGNTGIPDIPVLSIVVDPANPSRLYVGTDLGVFTSTDGGANWMVENTGFANVSTEALTIQGTSLYAFTHGRGAYRVALSGGGGTGPCVANATTLCLNGGRFKVQVQYSTPQGQSGAGQAVSLTSDTGYLWFFSASNVEMVVKVVDGRTFNGKFWVFAAGLTNVNVVMTVTDTVTGAVKVYTNPQNTAFQPIQDTGAFAASAPEASATAPIGADTSSLAAGVLPELNRLLEHSDSTSGALSGRTQAQPQGKRTVSANGLFLNGNVTYSVLLGTSVARLTADQVANTRSSPSGTLRLALWFTSVPFAQATSGFRTAIYPMGALPAGNAFFNVDSGVIAWSRPPDGNYYVTLALEELVSGQYVQQDFVQFSVAVTIGSLTCTADATTLCLNNGRFRVQVQYSTPQGQSGAGQAVALTGDTGYFWFFSPTNVEMVIKVVTGCPLNSRFWVFAGGLTNVNVTMTVTDIQTGIVKTYTNPQNTAFQPLQDTGAFATCP